MVSRAGSKMRPEQISTVNWASTMPELMIGTVDVRNDRNGLKEMYHM